MPDTIDVTEQDRAEARGLLTIVSICGVLECIDCVNDLAWAIARARHNAQQQEREKWASQVDSVLARVEAVESSMGLSNPLEGAQVVELLERRELHIDNLEKELAECRAALEWAVDVFERMDNINWVAELDAYVEGLRATRSSSISNYTERDLAAARSISVGCLCCKVDNDPNYICNVHHQFAEALALARMYGRLEAQEPRT